MPQQVLTVLNPLQAGDDGSHFVHHGAPTGGPRQCAGDGDRGRPADLGEPLGRLGDRARRAVADHEPAPQPAERRDRSPRHRRPGRLRIHAARPRPGPRDERSRCRRRACVGRDVRDYLPDEDQVAPHARWSAATGSICSSRHAQHIRTGLRRLQRARSGSTLLRWLIDAHDEISCRARPTSPPCSGPTSSLRWPPGSTPTRPSWRARARSSTTSWRSIWRRPARRAGATSRSPT